MESIDMKQRLTLLKLSYQENSNGPYPENMTLNFLYP